MTGPRVAVIGAGPAGSTAARLLAERGADVTLFEARLLPRPKLCGGGLTPKAQRLVPTKALDTVERLVRRVELRGPHLRPIAIADPSATIAMVERDRFDHALVEAAQGAGVTVRDGEPVRDLVEDESGVLVRTDDDHAKFEVVVVADGEPSGMARRSGLVAPAKRLALGLEVDLPFAARLGEDTALISFGLPGGYGWYFPKGDHANVGVGSYHQDRHDRLRDALTSFADGLGLDASESHVSGHWIPQGLRTGPVATRRVILAGDAAATVDSFFGEGISYAITSGMVAARTIEAWSAGTIDDLRAYDHRLRLVLERSFRRLDRVARAVELSVTGALLAVRLSRWVRERAIDAVVGRGSFSIDQDDGPASASAVGLTEPRRRSPDRDPAPYIEETGA